VSRSFGDQCAKTIGVSVMPEINEFTLDKETKIVVQATSAVWEAFSNDKLLSLITPFWF